MWEFCKLTYSQWQKHHVSWLAAALAYYTLFSLGPTFIVLIETGGLIFGDEAVKGEIVIRLQSLVGLEAAEAVQSMIEAGQSAGTGFFQKFAGGFIFLFAATSVFIHLRDTLNKIWNVESNDRHWVFDLLLVRGLSILIVLSIGIVLLILVLIEIGLAGFGKILAAYVPAFTEVHIWRIGNVVVSFIIVTLLFAVIYKTLPETKIAWMDVWGGAAFASFLFTIAKFLIGIYLGSSRVISLFGAASSFVVILVWVYFSVQILFLGAEISQVYSTQYGSRQATGSETESK